MSFDEDSSNYKPVREGCGVVPEAAPSGITNYVDRLRKSCVEIYVEFSPKTGK